MIYASLPSICERKYCRRKLGSQESTSCWKAISSFFYIVLFGESFLKQECFQTPEEMEICWRKIRRVSRMRQYLHAQVNQFLLVLAWNMRRCLVKELDLFYSPGSAIFSAVFILYLIHGCRSLKYMAGEVSGSCKGLLQQHTTRSQRSEWTVRLFLSYSIHLSRMLLFCQVKVRWFAC